MKQRITVVCLIICTLVCLAPSLHAQDQVFTNKLGMRFIPVPGGRFLMGSPKSETGHTRDETRHTVFISKNFYIQETEVTQGQWETPCGIQPVGISRMRGELPRGYGFMGGEHGVHPGAQPVRGHDQVQASHRGRMGVCLQGPEPPPPSAPAP